MAHRSTDANDYQFVPRPLAAMSKSFRDGFEIEPHHHARDQLVYAVTGVMRVRTAEGWDSLIVMSLLEPEHAALQRAREQGAA